jgi:hypothetical protein
MPWALGLFAHLARKNAHACVDALGFGAFCPPSAGKTPVNADALAPKTIHARDRPRAAPVAKTGLPQPSNRLEPESGCALEHFD